MTIAPVYIPPCELCAEVAHKTAIIGLYNRNDEVLAADTWFVCDACVRRVQRHCQARGHEFSVEETV